MPTTPQTALRLSPHTRELADQFGRGNMTTGITAALAAIAHLVDDQLPLPLTRAQLTLLLEHLNPTLANIPNHSTILRAISLDPAAWLALREAAAKLTPPQLIALAAAHDTYRALVPEGFPPDYNALFDATFHLT
jgi:hypothetical protein